MDTKVLQQNFKVYMRERFPNDSNISLTVSMAFSLTVMVTSIADRAIQDVVSVASTLNA